MRTRSSPPALHRSWPLPAAATTTARLPTPAATTTRSPSACVVRARQHLHHRRQRRGRLRRRRRPGARGAHVAAAGHAARSRRHALHPRLEQPPHPQARPRTATIAPRRRPRRARRHARRSGQLRLQPPDQRSCFNAGRRSARHRGLAQQQDPRRSTSRPARSSTPAATAGAPTSATTARRATAALDLPASIAFDPDGNLVIMDQANQVIRTVDAEGNIHRLAGQCVIDAPPPAGPGAVRRSRSPCPGGVGQADLRRSGGHLRRRLHAGLRRRRRPATMRMAQPFGQSADPAGRIVFDADGNLVLRRHRQLAHPQARHRTAASRIVAGLRAGRRRGRRTATRGDGGPATEAKLNRPVDLALGAGRHALLHRRVQPLRPRDRAGRQHPHRGRRSAASAATTATAARPTEALLKRPYGIEFADGTLYIADTGNYVIRAVGME